MKLLFVAYDSPDYHGGPIVNLRRLLPELKRRGHEPAALLIYHGTHPSSAGYLEERGVPCRSLPWRDYVEPHVRWLLRQVRDIHPDVFIPNMTTPGFYAARWAREAGIPTIAAYRGDEGYYDALVNRFVLGDPEWAVSGLVCVAEGLAQRVRDRHPARTRVTVIPSGVPVPSRTCDEGGALRLVYAGRLVQKAKRIQELVGSLIRAVSEHAGATAMVLGDGPDRAALESMVNQAGLHERIRFAGYVPPEQMPARLADGNVLVLLSDHEGTPGGVMDGMACGLVPVCLDIPGGVRELVRHEQTGLLVPDRNEGFQSAVRRLAADPALRKRLGQAAREHIIRGYSLGVAADRWVQFCGELLDEPARRRRPRIPLRLGLPPVDPGLGSEDERRPPWTWRCKQRLLARIKKKRSCSTD